MSRSPGPVPLRALAIFAHPDDADLSCGGTLAAWAAAGSAVYIVVVALGDKGSDALDTDVAALVARRHGELEAGAALLGVREVDQLGHRDGEFDNDPLLRRELVGAIRRIRPEVIVCPDPSAIFFGERYYNHRDHRTTGWAALDAAAPAASSPLYFPEAGPSWRTSELYLAGSLEANLHVDISSVIDKKVEAVLGHKSQLGDARELYAAAVRERAEQEGKSAGVSFAEAFRRIQLSV